MTDLNAVLSLLTRLERSLGAVEAQLAERDAEIAALRQHLADHPANQEPADAN